MRTLDRSRLGIAAQALGIQFKLADMETNTAAARELLYRAAAEAEREEPGFGKHSVLTPPMG